MKRKMSHIANLRQEKSMANYRAFLADLPTIDLAPFSDLANRSEHTHYFVRLCCVVIFIVLQLDVILQYFSQLCLNVEHLSQH